MIALSLSLAKWPLQHTITCGASHFLFATVHWMMAPLRGNCDISRKQRFRTVPWFPQRFFPWKLHQVLWPLAAVPISCSSSSSLCRTITRTVPGTKRLRIRPSFCCATWGISSGWGPCSSFWWSWASPISRNFAWTKGWREASPQRSWSR